MLQGETVAGFLLLEPMGKREPSSVYMARDTESGARVVVKFARADAAAGSDRDRLTRLRSEAEALRTVSHPAIPRLLVSADDEHEAYLAREMIEGTDLEYIFSKAASIVPPHQLATVLAKLADALAAVHRAGFIHGDVHPGNVVLDGGGTPHLIDFGSARCFGSEAGSEQRTLISLVPGYAAPECHDAGARIGPLCDIYALGAIGYRAVTGRVPPSAVERRTGTLESAVESGRPIYSLALRAAIDWAMELEPGERPSSAEEFRDTMLACAAQPEADAMNTTIRVRRVHPTAIPASIDRPSSRSAGRRRRAGRTFGAVALVLLLAPAAWFGHATYLEHTRSEWLVDPGGSGDVLTISEALTRARDRATIRVKPGVYRESLTIDRPLALVGIPEGDKAVVIETPGTPCIAVNADDVQLVALTIHGGGALTDSVGACVDVTGGRSSIERSEIRAERGTAVQASNGATLRFSESAVLGSKGPAIVLARGAAAEIVNVVVRGTEAVGIVVRGGADLSASDVEIDSPGAAGVVISEGARASLQRIAIAAAGKSGLEILGAARVVLNDSLIDGAAEAGVLVADGAHAGLERTKITKSGLSGVIVAPTSRVELASVAIEESHEHGIVVADLAELVLRNSRVIGNEGHGVGIQPLGLFEEAGNTLERNHDPQRLDERRTVPPRQSSGR